MWKGRSRNERRLACLRFLSLLLFSVKSWAQFLSILSSLLSHPLSVTMTRINSLFPSHWPASSFSTDSNWLLFLWFCTSSSFQLIEIASMNQAIPPFSFSSPYSTLVNLILSFLVLLPHIYTISPFYASPTHFPPLSLSYSLSLSLSNVYPGGNNLNMNTPSIPGS